MVRIDDVDLIRSVPGTDKIILEQLERLGLYWDENVVYQSHRFDLYQSALDKLQSSNVTFPCSCSRKTTAHKPYPGTCRNGIKPDQTACSIRIKTDNNKTGIFDLLQGNFTQRLESKIGDFIIKRADNIFAYHLATVVDDAEQNISQIVRGIDLLESTPRQVYLQKKLNFITPLYLHLPIAIDKSGKKISKSDEVDSVTLSAPEKVLYNALDFLGQKPPKLSLTNDVESILDWAIKNWKPDNLPKEKEIIVSDNACLNR